MKNRILIVFISILLVSCNNNTKEIKEIYLNRIEILQNFENLSVYRRGKGISVEFYKDSLHNEYIFEESNLLFSKDTLKFINDTIQFDLKQLNKSYLVKEGMVKNFSQYCLDKMTEYKIKSVYSGFKKFGITLELDLQNCQVLYVSDVKSIRNSQWIEFVKAAHKLDDYWYWREYDKIE